MLTISKELDITIENLSYTGYAANELVFFDIETTGFSPETTILYMIGCIYHQQNRWICVQWFSENADSQKDVLIAFFEFIKNYKILICYNGQGFDIPYLTKKCRMYRLHYSFENIGCIDLYKSITPLKPLFKTENLKQKTMEVFIGLMREDKYSGGELIEYYDRYLKNSSSQLLDMLCLHNREDLSGMTSLISLLSYQYILSDHIKLSGITLSTASYTSASGAKEAVFTFTLPYSVPKRVSCGNNMFYFSACNTTAELIVNVHNDELKYFYPNYKDYYYLPVEDKAIHKSVAFYVDKNFRTKAKAANCYSRKTGHFLPQYSEIVKPYFKIDYYDKMTYFELTEEFKGNNSEIILYFHDVLLNLIKAADSR